MNDYRMADMIKMKDNIIEHDIRSALFKAWAGIFWFVAILWGAFYFPHHYGFDTFAWYFFPYVLTVFGLEFLLIWAIFHYFSKCGDLKRERKEQSEKVLGEL